jgi:hypothetical protein
VTHEQSSAEPITPHWVMGLTSGGQACLSVFGKEANVIGVVMNAQEARLLAKQANAMADFLEERGRPALPKSLRAESLHPAGESPSA